MLSYSKPFLRVKKITSNIFAKHTDHGFLISMKLQEKMISLKFDTGAARTVLSLGILFNEMTDEKRALLGDNFIDCCEFSHDSHHNIVIRGFDSAAYGMESNWINSDEISELVS